MIHLKTAAEIDTIAQAGAILAALYREIPGEIRPGVTTADLDRWAEAFIRSHPGAIPAFKGLYGFPATLCVSVNHEVVHGIPSTRRPLKEGDVLSVDCGVKLEGFYADAAITCPVGAIAPEAQGLLDRTQEALARGIAEARPGHRLGDVGAAIQEVADEAGYGVVRELVGHGVGRQPHEEPQVPNFGKRGKGLKLVEGMVLAIEPMFNLGTANVRTLPDRWTVVTADRKVSAHFEHTVAVTADGPRILTG
ncbi:type I methionyl aminopeptidase [Longimicrobium terrae]|uniref:Methionine aminopeptidase n=1 Tax=Longimicrobium terrae TaxID=1639882 RepID=A0A841GTV9_9BACT|nr:methionyl aminopeptidase [Longimicrobium terrae]MBB6068638.1 methionyl aminopeptidase [Longimicrobium terrae]NNC27824.1 type I methionyl aminopeptidase [Longimicrobium terrae]